MMLDEDTKNIMHLNKLTEDEYLDHQREKQKSKMNNTIEENFTLQTEYHDQNKNKKKLNENKSLNYLKNVIKNDKIMWKIKYRIIYININ